MKLGDFELLNESGEQDLRALIQSFNDNQTDYPRDTTVHAVFSEQARERPDDDAIYHGERVYSYRDLEQASNRFARFLIQHEIGPQEPVAVILEHTFEMAVALLGILKAGAAYLPIDFDTPLERMRYLIDDTQARIAVSQRSYIRKLNKLQRESENLEILFCADSRQVNDESEGTGKTMRGEVRDKVGKTAVVDISTQTPRRKHQYDLRSLDSLSDSSVDGRGSPNSLAYIIYTSGTSGKPKGVMVEHRSIIRLVKNTNYLQLSPSDRILQTGALAFDASTFEIWGALLNGGSLCRLQERAVLDSSEAGRLILKHGITTMWLTSSLFNQYVDSDLNLFAGLKHLLVGGEKLSPTHINRVRQRYPDLTMINGYGPTECTTFAICHRIERDYDSDIPIGKPISNTEVLILDESGSLVPIGVAGEIHLSGDGLARGYLNDEALTRQKFVPHVFDSNQRMYRTGDSGLWRADGTVEYIGRIDDQIKIRGYRIEPAEIEHHLLAFPGVQQAVVLAQDLGDDTRELVAYLIPDASSGKCDESTAHELDIQAVRERLKRNLPDYQVPAHFVLMTAFDLTANGKIDRKSLPLPAEVNGTSHSRSRVAPATPIEEQLALIWSEVLGRPDIGVTDDFFDSGGHSLKVAKVLAEIQKELGVQIPLATFFTYSTIRTLTQAIIEITQFGVAEIDEAMVPMNANESGPVVFAFPPGTGDALGFLQLAEALRPHRINAFNFILAESRLHDYADLVESVDPQGPYVFFGYSSGGNLAYHVARVLEERGKRVSRIVMVDSARKLARIPIPKQEVDQVVADFLSHESTLPFDSSLVLREKAEHLIRSSFAYVENAVDFHSISADIYVFTSEDRDLEHRDADGNLLVSVPKWKDVTTGELKVIRGVGGHNHMLYQPHLHQNAPLIRESIEGV